MGQYLEKLSIGEMVKAEVVELQSSTEVVVNFYGDLLRIQNKTGRPFKLGQQIDLIIVNVKPFKFSLANHSSFRSSKLNISV